MDKSEGQVGVDADYNQVLDGGDESHGLTLTPEIRAILEDSDKRGKLKDLIGKLEVVDRKEASKVARIEVDAKRKAMLANISLVGGGVVTVGDSQGLFPRSHDHAGIYINGDYIGNVEGKAPMKKMTELEFLDATLELLDSRGVQVEDPLSTQMTLKNSLPLEVNEDTIRVMKRWQIAYEDDHLEMGVMNKAEYSRLNLNTGDNARIRFEALNDRTVYFYTEEKDGKVVRYTIRNGVFELESEKDVTPR
jgi:hypothetical protein